MRSRDQRQMDHLAARAPRVLVGPQATINVLHTRRIATVSDGVWEWTGERWERM